MVEFEMHLVESTVAQFVKKIIDLSVDNNKR